MFQRCHVDYKLFAGHITPLRLKKKSNSSRSPENTPPFSKRFLERYPNVLDLHNIVNNKI